LQGVQGRRDEEAERYVRAGRISWQREDRDARRPDRAEALRHARLHGHLAEGDCAPFLQGSLDGILLAAHAHPAAGDQHVGARHRLPNRGQNVILIVPDDPMAASKAA
jgi:hypothetical protein